MVHRAPALRDKRRHGRRLCRPRPAAAASQGQGGRDICPRSFPADVLRMVHRTQPRSATNAGTDGGCVVLDQPQQPRKTSRREYLPTPTYVRTCCEWSTGHSRAPRQTPARTAAVSSSTSRSSFTKQVGGNNIPTPLPCGRAAGGPRDTPALRTGPPSAKRALLDTKPTA
jgi:hypothetical protein